MTSECPLTQKYKSKGKEEEEEEQKEEEKEEEENPGREDIGIFGKAFKFSPDI